MEAITEFELRITFAGLCSYVLQPDRKRAAVLMPDARKERDPWHVDGRRGEPHVGYLRFNLANLGGIGIRLDPGDGEAREANGPRYEAIHRLTGQTLAIKIPDDGETLTVRGFDMPDVGTFAPTLALLPKLDDRKLPVDTPLLFRTILRGGTLSGVGKSTWEIPPTLDTDGKGDAGLFAGWVTWTRKVKASSMSIELSDFRNPDAGKVEIPLTPVPIRGSNVVELKIGNLCADNPLEWDELWLRTTDFDKDFKWLYRLLQPKSSTWKDLLKDEELPFPHVKQGVGTRGEEDCIGNQMTVSMAEFDRLSATARAGA